MKDARVHGPTHVMLPLSPTRPGPNPIPLGGRQALPTFVPWLLVALMCCTPVAALDEHPSLLSYQRHASFPRAPIGSIVRICLLIGGVAITVSSNIIGPLMGISSVLWLIMRNDQAVDPRMSWMMFGAWFFFGMSYFMLQCRRVYNHRLYIFLSIALACTCMCVVAIIQKSSLQSGLVTVIPPCTPFAAYAVAYFFPDWHQEKTTLNV